MRSAAGAEPLGVRPAAIGGFTGGITNMSVNMAAAAVAAAGIVLAAGVGAPGQARAETTLSLVYPFPDQLIYTKMCKRLAAEISEKGKGLVKIDVLPFNSIKMFQQPPAVKSGRVDLSCIPSAFYARSIPENEVISTSNSTAAKVRANGGTAMIDELHGEHFNLKYLGWTTSGAHFRIYMKDAPKWTADGLLDLKGVKLRDNPIYGAFFRALNASTHSLPATDVYAALEKGVVDASAWATIGLPALKWDKFVRHAVEPEFYQTDVGWIANLDKWNKLPAAARTLIQNAMVAEEVEAHAVMQRMAREEKALLQKNGMKFHTAPNAAKYLEIAIDSAYDRMVARLEKKGRDTAHLQKLRSLFQE